MSLETYHEIQEIAEEFEDSLTRALVPLHADDNEEHDGEEATAEPVEPEETLAYLEIGGKEEVEPAGIMTSWPVCNKQHYDMHTVCSQVVS